MLRMRTIISVISIALLLSLTSGCKGSGCDNDAECKGTRICERGQCVESQAPAQGGPAGSLPQVAATPAPPPPPTSAPLSPSGPCMPCSTQEDFDAAMRKRRKCCPVTACQVDSQCPDGRVCCRIPNGQLCADAARCASGDRVQGSKFVDRAAGCRNFCPGGEISHCYCVCMGECTD